MNWHFCPNCGHRTYQHGYIGCQHKTQKHHILRLGADLAVDGWTLKHPLAERERDQLFDCKIHASVMNDGGVLPSGPSEWAIIVNANGGWSFEPRAKAYVQCDCEWKGDCK